MRYLLWKLRCALILWLAGESTVALNFTYTGTMNISGDALMVDCVRRSVPTCFTGDGPRAAAPIPLRR